MNPARVTRSLLAVALLSVLWTVHREASTNPSPPPAAPVAPHAAYLQPVADLTPEQLRTFRAGEKVFNNFWIAIPNDVISQWWDLSQPGPGGGGWGLGPTFLATSCVSCHVQAGRGQISDRGAGPLFQQTLRLSIPGEDAHGGPLPDPNYGLQIQSFDIIRSKDRTRQAGEAEVHVDWETVTFRFADGDSVTLRKPAIRLAHLNFGPLTAGTRTSLRNTQALVGLGYLEAVSEEDILALAELQKSQGLNGRPNYVRDDINDRMSLGRFGWKANQPSLRQQIASAFHSDIGITSSLYPEQNCPPAQKECLKEVLAEKPELGDDLWQAVSFWTTALDAPLPRDTDKPAVRRGEQLFHQVKCAQCHVPELKTGPFPTLPAVANKRIRPYTDLLLHDMGPDLADGRPDFRASGTDWRTPPLWGLGRSKQVNGSTHLLHDGRARNVLEAVVWHGGEAAPARDAFAKLPKQDRQALVAFLESL